METSDQPSVSSQNGTISSASGAETVQTTQFIDAVQSTDNAPMVMDNDLGTLDYVHSIQNILARPTLIKTMTLDGSTVALNPLGPNAEVFSFHPLHDTLYSSNKISKIQNFEFLRAVVSVKVMVNANPFTCGKLWVCYSPMDDVIVPGFRINDKGYCGITAYPGIELDLQVNNTVEIDIPWTPLTEGVYTSSQLDAEATRVYIYALGPLQGPGGFKVNMQIFSWLKNVELRAPTFKIPPPSQVPLAAIRQIQTEAEGPITQVSGFIAKGAGFLSKIPMLTEYAAPVEWVANSVNKVASIFGFSRPIEGSGAGARCLIPARGMGQNVCQDQSVALAFSNDNTLGSEAVFLTPIDEMDIQHVSARPALVTRGSYSTTSSGILIQEACSTGCGGVRTAINEPGNQIVVSFTPFEYIAQMFSNWRADINFRISFAKTAFHTGRVEIVFVPGPVKPLFDFDSSNCYRTVLDLSKYHEIDFVCPYISIYETLFTNSLNEYSTVSVPADDQGAFGWIVLRALTPLLCPDSVSQSIDYYIYKHATNVLFAGTCGTDVYFQATKPPIEPPPLEAEYQIQICVNTQSEKFVASGAPNTGATNLRVAQRVCGEILENLRPLTRAHRPLFDFPSTTSKSQVISTQIYTNPLNFRTVQPDIIGYLAALYVYSRGGTSFKFCYKGDGTDNFIPMVTTLERTWRGGAGKTLTPTSTHLSYPFLTPIHEVQMPFYCSTKRLLNNLNDDESEESESTFQPDIIYDGPGAVVYRAGKDDFDFGCLIGPPTMRVQLNPPTYSKTD